MKTKLLTIALLFSALLGFAEKPFKCTIKGVTINRDNSKTLFLIKTSDARERIRQPISIHDNAFEFTFDVMQTEAYQLVFEDEINNGAWHPVIFFPIAGEVNFKLYPMEQAEKDEVTGGQLNKDNAAFNLSHDKLYNPRFKALSDKRVVLEKNKDYYSLAHDSLVNIMMHTSHEKVDRSVYLKLTELEETGDEFTPNGKLLKKERDLLHNEINAWRYKYVNANPTLFSYYLILQDVYGAKNNPVVAEAIKKAYPQFAAKYPEHSYTKIVGNELNGLYKVKVGQPLIDFSAPDLKGNVYSLAELAKGKVTLIDLWGSWCGPCIAATRTMIPVYNEFKNKNFTMIGIAREFKTTKDLSIALKREKYEWLNLVELDDKNEIWNKYGISNGTGLMILIDKQGKIIAINPTAEAVKKILLAKL